MGIVDKQQAVKILQDDNATGTGLLVLLTDAFGTEFFGWAPDSLSLALADEWGVVPSPVNRDKIDSLVTILTTDLFHRDLQVFLQTCRALSNDDADFDFWVPADVSQIAWGVLEAALHDPEASQEPFHDDILKYIRLRLEYEGFAKPPVALRKLVPDVRGMEAAEAAFAGDEAAFKAFYDLQEQKQEEVESWVRGRMREVAFDLRRIPLRGDRTGAMQLAEKLQAAAAEGEASKSPVRGPADVLPLSQDPSSPAGL